MNPILVRVLTTVAIHVAIDHYKEIKHYGMRKYREHKVRKAFAERKPHASK